MAVGCRKYRTSPGSSQQHHLVFGFLLRVIFIVYGEHHDQYNALKYTDADYYVVTDAAQLVLNGESPFNRHTYRYTPYLSWIMIPNVTVTFVWGKVLFSVADCLVAKLICTILELEGCSKKVALYSSFIWLYNPIIIGISTRGSFDVLMTLVVLCMVYLLKLRLPVLTGAFLGIAIHLKLYPLIYLLPVYLSFIHSHGISFWQRCLPNKARVKLLIGVSVSFALLTGLGIVLYGKGYLQEAFLYHLLRTDTRHNFSVYFYLLYIAADYEIPGLGIILFLPQLILLIALSLKLGRYSDISFCLFAQTLVFVTFNKVVTSQYFVWYLTLLPIVIPSLAISLRKAVFLVSLWLMANGSWLFTAYLLEFHAINAFVPVWLESIAFFCCNLGVLLSLISSYCPHVVGHFQAVKKDK